jgi:hypothetical protein
MFHCTKSEKEYRTLKNVMNKGQFRVVYPKDKEEVKKIINYDSDDA